MSHAEKSGRRTQQQVRGQAGEDAALDYLLRQGLILLERNFRCRTGEIDLIMRDRDGLVFVEVRTRRASHFGGAAASVTAAKRTRLSSAAQTYLQRYRIPPPCRFDVIAIDEGSLEWLQNAIQG